MSCDRQLDGGLPGQALKIFKIQGEFNKLLVIILNGRLQPPMDDESKK